MSKKRVGENHSLAGKTVVLTGALTTRRADIVKLLKQAGAHVATGVSKNTDILVAGDKVSISSCTPSFLLTLFLTARKQTHKG